METIDTALFVFVLNDGEPATASDVRYFLFTKLVTVSSINSKRRRKKIWAPLTQIDKCVD